MPNPHVTVQLQQLKLLYPAAFKHNYLLYGQIKTKGLFDDRRELLPWLLAAIIFIPISLVLKDVLSTWLGLTHPLQAQSYAILVILLALMLMMPVVIKQIRHSSHSLYQLVQHHPLKLTAVILLSVLNMVYLQNTWLMWSLLFFGIRFGFIRFYKENLFRQATQPSEQYQLHQLRRICFWAYKQNRKTYFKLRLISKQHAQYPHLSQQLNQYATLYTQLLQMEHQYCKQIKHIDIDSYLDEKL